MTDIFKDRTAEMPSWWEKPARTALEQSETLNMARLPGCQKVPGRDVEHVTRPRYGRKVD